MRRRSSSRRDVDELDLSIDIDQLKTPPPDEHSRVGLAFYGAPVRLAVLVVAPTGREGRLPSAAEMGGLLEHWLPGIEKIAAQDQPVFRRWPEQLSIQGFQHAFFQNLSLPGDRGKSSPWCSACGPFLADGHRYLVGVVCRTAAANSLSEVAIERETQWLDVVRPR